MIALALGAAPAARAQALSTDIEIVHPVLTPSAPPGMDGARFDETQRLRGAVFAWYARNPLVLRYPEEPDTSVVANRLTFLVGAAWDDKNERFGLRVTAPLAGQWGTASPDFGADGFAAGDLRGGVRVKLAGSPWLATAVHLDLSAPTGTDATWMGGRTEVHGGWSGAAFGERGSAAIDLGVVGRPVSEAATALRFSSAIEWGLGGQLVLRDGLLAQAETLGRIGIDPFAGAGTVGNELLGGVRILPTRTTAVDVMGGRGLGRGVGTTDFRLLAGFTLLPVPKDLDDPDALLAATPPPAPREPVGVDDADDDRPPPPPRQVDCPDVFVEREEPETPPPPEAAAWVIKERIEIREAIQFAVATARILDTSRPTLDAVAKLLAERPELAHVVVVGHASEEGSYAYNYKLSMARAVAVFEALIAAGVHPDRLSVRAMGEVGPKAEGEDEAQSAESSRRVEFRIERQLVEGEPFPQYIPIERYPWDGAEVPK